MSEKIHQIKNARMFDSKTLETLTVPEEETLLQYMIDEYSQGSSQREQQRNRIKNIQDHLKQRKQVEDQVKK